MTIKYKESAFYARNKRINTLTRIVKDVNEKYYVTQYYSNSYDMDSNSYEHFLIKESSDSWWRSDKHICYVEIHNIYKPGGFIVDVEIGGGKLYFMDQIATVFDNLKWLVTIINNGI